MSAINLLNVDCMEYMKTCSDEYFDLAIVDPPYGIKLNQMQMGGRVKGGRNAKRWDDSAPSKDYFDELMRVSKHQIIFGGNYFPLPPTRCFIVWDKGESMYGRCFSECELAWTSMDTPARIYKQNPNQLDRIHPAQKPIALYSWLLHRFAKRGQRVLDTHLGSGNSAIAAHFFGVDFVGCEIDADYFASASTRFAELTNQHALF